MNPSPLFTHPTNSTTFMKRKDGFLVLVINFSCCLWFDAIDAISRWNRFSIKALYRPFVRTSVFILSASYIKYGSIYSIISARYIFSFFVRHLIEKFDYIKFILFFIMDSILSKNDVKLLMCDASRYKLFSLFVIRPWLKGCLMCIAYSRRATFVLHRCSSRKDQTAQSRPPVEGSRRSTSFDYICGSQFCLCTRLYASHLSCRRLSDTVLSSCLSSRRSLYIQRVQ